MAEHRQQHGHQAGARPPVREPQQTTTTLSAPSIASAAGEEPNESPFGQEAGTEQPQPPRQAARGGGAVDFLIGTRGATQPPFMGRKVSDGLSVRVVCPDGDTSQQGEFHYLDGFFGFNLTRPKLEPDGDVPIILQVEQAEYETLQVDPGGTFAAGAKVFFTPGAAGTPGVLEDGAGTIYVGIVTVAKDASGAIWMHLAAQGAKP